MSTRLVMVGPPGSGKGTQAVLIQEEFKIPQISTGIILRAAVREGTPLGKQVAELMSSGKLVSDEIIVGIMKERMKEDDLKNGYILDGFPRTLGQAEALDEMLGKSGQKLDMAISVEVSDDEVVKRLAGRRGCTGCGEGYHLQFKRPAKENVCDKCGSALYLRDDDTEKTVRDRLSVYRKQTAPLLDYYKKQGILKGVSGTGSIEDIFKNISSLIRRSSPQS